MPSFRILHTPHTHTHITNTYTHNKYIHTYNKYIHTTHITYMCTSPKASDVQGYSLALTTSGQSADLSSLLPHGTMVYSTVVCTNGAGLSTQVTSDGLTILVLPPTSSSITLLTSTSLYTVYDVQQGFLPSNLEFLQR